MSAASSPTGASGAATDAATPTWAAPQAIAIEKVEAGLRTLWQSAGPGGTPITRVQTMTIVAVCETPAHQADAHAALVEAAKRHGARTLTVVADDAAAPSTPSIEAAIALHPCAGKADRPGGEDVTLRARGAARAWIPDAIGKLLTPDVPTYVWWVGDLPDDDRLFDRIAPLAKLVIFDSNDMDLRDLATLRTIGNTDRGYALADVAWNRLRHWQELLARFFDDPACAGDLARVDAATIRFRDRKDPARTADPVSNLAALYAGWLCHALGWTLERWEGGVARLKASPDRSIALRFEAVASPATAGSLVSIELRAGEARYEVARNADDPRVICWTGERPGASIPQQCVRVPEPTTPKVLARLLERPLRDPLFEASLDVATTMFDAIAPRPSRPDAKR